MFQNHIYYNENLFRSIELCWVIIIRIDFSHDLTNFELIPQNHSADFGHFGQNAQNRFLNIKIFIFFQENDIGLKSDQRYDFRSLITVFSSDTSRSRFCDFLKKSASLKDFVRKCTSNIQGTVSQTYEIDR